MLDKAQLRRFAQDGYLLIPGVVAEAHLAALDDEIGTLLRDSPPPDDLVGRYDYVMTPAQLPQA